jgi:hypothetical protein
MLPTGNVDILRVWRQARIPVVYRQGGGDPLLVRIPYGPDNKTWIRGGRRHKPQWNAEHGAWEVPQSWLDAIIPACLNRFGKVYVIQPYRQQEKCAPACWSAKGYECQCSCMGANHGSQHPSGNWRIVSDTFAVRWHDRELACRLITAKPNRDFPAIGAQ